MTYRMMSMAALALAALTSDAARADCQAQRAHDLGCTLECVRGQSCSNPECGQIIAKCDAYFNSQLGTRCGEFCRNNRGQTYRSINTCLQQCNSGPMPSRPGSRPAPATAKRPTAWKPTARKPTPARPTAKPSAYGQSSKARTPSQRKPAQRKPQPKTNQRHTAGDNQP